MPPDRRFQELAGIELPIIQAPMAGFVSSEMVVAVSEAGGLGSVPCALLTPDQAKAELRVIRDRTNRPINVNFFCHVQAGADPMQGAAWRERLAAYYAELGLASDPQPATPSREPFSDAMCEVVEEFAPEVVSFHFGLPEPRLVERVKAAGCKVVSSATSVDEARWLEGEGCDAIIAQGYEAGGHRGMFLFESLDTQVGTMALVPQVVDAVKVPVIAAGGIADARGVAAAFALGASAVQVGTAYLFCPEAKVSLVHREALRNARDNTTALTNVFSGRPARAIINRLVLEVGPMSKLAPAFPFATGAIIPLREKAETTGSGDFSPLWSGQAASLARAMPAGELTRALAEGGLARLRQCAEPPAMGASANLSAGVEQSMTVGPQ